jgi:hypothetical protein
MVASGFVAETAVGELTQPFVLAGTRGSTTAAPGGRVSKRPPKDMELAAIAGLARGARYAARIARDLIRDLRQTREGTSPLQS